MNGFLESCLRWRSSRLRIAAGRLCDRADENYAKALEFDARIAAIRTARDAKTACRAHRDDLLRASPKKP